MATVEQGYRPGYYSRYITGIDQVKDGQVIIREYDLNDEAFQEALQKLYKLGFHIYSNPRRLKSRRRWRQ